MPNHKELAQRALNKPDARKSLDLYNEAVAVAKETEEWKVRMIELKRCPFCGGKATIDNNGSTVWWVECNNDCQIQPGTPVFSKPSKAIEAWNRRV